MTNWFCNFNFLVRFYIRLIKLSVTTLNYLLCSFILILNVVLLFFKNLFFYIVSRNTTINNLYIFIKNIFYNFIYFSFKVLPWWLYNVFIKIHILSYVNFIKLFLLEHGLLNDRMIKLFNIVFYKITVFIKYIFNKFKLFLFKFIGFIFQKKNNKFLISLLYISTNIFLILFTIFLILKTSIIIIIHNFFFGGLIDVFNVWGLKTSKINYFYLFILLLNIDNLILVLYLIFAKLGFLNVVLYKRETINWVYWIWYNWIDYFITYKSDNQNFSFANLILNNLVEDNKGFFNNITGFIFYNFSSESLPVFYLFGILFFLSVIFSWFFLSYLGLNGLYKLNLITLFLFWFSLLLYIKYIFVDQKIFILDIGSWVFLNLNIRIDYYFLIDTISFSFILLTTSIALFVFIYAFAYFKYEPLVDRFLLFILSFVISMIFLVSSGNTIMLFLGWELIGFTSFCLINFWTTKTATLKSAFKAFTFNKISDFFLFLFLVFSFSIYYTFDITQINKIIPLFNYHIIHIINFQINTTEILAILLVGAAFIKSAQFGGHAWLPDSMEAPVPASALIHSATLVSAGIYLILRFNSIFDSTEFVKIIIPVIGSLTAAYGGICAVSQSDIKKTLAYSTISHCGFLMVLCSTEMNEFTILYLYVHGFFKAGVFMCVGNVLRISRGYQDTRRMGGLFRYLPFDYFCITIGLLNLAGIPFTFGFVIKHLLLISLNNNIYLYYFVLFNSFIGAFSGLFYSYKIITYTFCDFKKGDIILYNNLNRINYNSMFYNNSSLAATISIFSLFIFAYIVIIYMFNCFLSGNYQFSDYINTTLLLNYFVVDYSFNGFLLNFSYINVVAVIIINYLFWSKFKKITRYYNYLKYFFALLIIFIFVFIFYNIL